MSDYIAIAIAILIVAVLGVTLFMGDNGVKKSITDSVSAGNTAVSGLANNLNTTNGVH